MTAEDWISIGTAVLSAAIAIVSLHIGRKNGKELEAFKADLSERSATHSARLEYEFEARKRLYLACGPLLFQLSEFAERANSRIAGLARSAADGQLEPGNSWLSRRYYSLSTYYWLLAPLCIGRLLQRRLTHVDLSLDKAVHWQYALVKQLANTFSDDFDLAGENDGVVTIPEEEWIEYDPHHGDAETLRHRDSATYWQQGIPRGILDNAVAALVTRDADGTERIMDFREFQDAYEDPEDAAGVRAPFERISYLFADFHPRSRPVLWRILVAQTFLYRAILASGQAGGIDPDPWPRLIAEAGSARFDWRSVTEKAEKNGVKPVPDSEIATAIRIGADYARQATAPLLASLTANRTTG